MKYEDIDKIAFDFSLIDRKKLVVISQLLQETKHLEADTAELGVYMGGTSRVISLTNPLRRHHCFDTFQGIPENDLHPNGIHTVGEFACNLDQVKQNLIGCNVVFHVGKFPETAFDTKYSFAHLDGPHGGEAIIRELEWFNARMDAGSTIAIDDVTSDFVDFAPIQAWLEQKGWQHIKTGNKKSLWQKK